MHIYEYKIDIYKENMVYDPPDAKMDQIENISYE